MKSDSIRLLKNLLAVAIIAAAGILGYRYFTGEKEELIIEDTPIQIQSIKTIAEISTVSYRADIVMDTVEYYDESINLSEHPIDWFSSLYHDKINRRLTLIIKGEVKYGLDLGESNYSIDSNQDTIWLTLPNPEVLDVIISPSDTEVFHEKGEWKDKARKSLETQAKVRITEQSETLNLHDKAKDNAETLFQQLILTDKQLIIQFDEDK